MSTIQWMSLTSELPLPVVFNSSSHSLGFIRQVYCNGELWDGVIDEVKRNYFF